MHKSAVYTVSPLQGFRFPQQPDCYFVFYQAPVVQGAQWVTKFCSEVLYSRNVWLGEEGIWQLVFTSTESLFSVFPSKDNCVHDIL